MKSIKQTGLQMRDPQNLNAVDVSRGRDSASPVMPVVVPYTTPELTRAALRHVAGSSDLDACVQLIDIEVVPFPCPLDQPPVSKEYAGLRVQKLLEESGLPGRSDVFYARERQEGYRRVLAPHSVVVLATRKRWWATPEKRLARFLTKAGHQVMVLDVL